MFWIALGTTFMTVWAAALLVAGLMGDSQRNPRTVNVKPTLVPADNAEPLKAAA